MRESDAGVLERRGGAWGRRGRVWCVVGAATLLACAGHQRVAIAVDPADALVFVDGEQAALEGGAVELRCGRPHKLFFKRLGYRGELVVLESREREARDEPCLSATEVDVRLAPSVRSAPTVQIEEE